MSDKDMADRIAARAFRFVADHEGDTIGRIEPISPIAFECEVGPPSEEFWEWMMGVSLEERMRQAVDEALGREGPLTVFKRFEQTGIVEEYLGARFNSMERLGDSVSIGVSFQQIRTWLVNPRSGGWICLDFEWVF